MTSIRRRALYSVTELPRNPLKLKEAEKIREKGGEGGSKLQEHKTRLLQVQGFNSYPVFSEMC